MAFSNPDSAKRRRRYERSARGSTSTRQRAYPLASFPALSTSASVRRFAVVESRAGGKNPSLLEAGLERDEEDSP